MPIFERLAYHRTRRYGARANMQASNGTKHVDGEAEPVEMDLRAEHHALDVLGESLTWDLCRVGLSFNLCHLTSVLSTTSWLAAFASIYFPRVVRPHASCLTPYQDEQFAIFATAVVALVHVVTGLNELQRAMIVLVGERDLGGGLDRAQERWARSDVEV